VFFINAEESVYSAVRTASLSKADYVYRLNRRNATRILQFNSSFTQSSPTVLRETQQETLWGSIPCRSVGWHWSFGKACCLQL